MTTDTQLIRFDWAIKTVLRDKANFDVLEGFLSALLKEDIEVLELLESEANQPDFENKYNRVDLLVKDSQQRHLIIEIQGQRVSAYLERLLFGVSKVIVDNLALGGDYGDVKKVISISILYFNFGLGNDYVYHGKTEFYGLHDQQPLKTRQGRRGTYQPINLFPEYYLINVERFEDVIASDLDEWMYLLKHSATRPEFKAKHIERAQEKLMLLGMTIEERRRYERYLMGVAIDRDVLQTAKTEGKTEGKQEAQLEIAQNLRQSGLAIDLIVKATGLTPEIIQSLPERDSEISPGV